MTTGQDTIKNPADMKMIGELLVIYLAIGTEFGDCELYRRIGAALESRDLKTLWRFHNFIESMPGQVKQRLIQGYDMDTSTLDDISKADLDSMAALIAEKKETA